MRVGHANRRGVGAVSTTALALVLVVPGAMAAEEPPEISVLFEDSLPAPGTTGDATFIVENLSDVEATFEGAIRFGDDDPARVLACASALAPPHADTEVTCSVESAADACDQELDLFMTYTWEGGPVDVSTTAVGDFNGVGACPQPSPPPAGPDTCTFEVVPAVSEVGEDAAIVATGLTPNGTGSIGEIDQVTDFNFGLYLFDDPDEVFFGNGSLEVTFWVEPFMVGRHLLVIEDHETGCSAQAIWTVVPDPDATPTPGPVRSGLQGSWAGTITIGNDTDQPFTVTLLDCAKGYVEPCGEITFRDENGVGCTFPLQFIGPESMPVGVPPPQDDQFVYDVGMVCIECDDLWLGSTYLYVRQVDGGDLEIAPVWPEVLPSITVEPAGPLEPDPPYSFTVDPTTVQIDGTLAISVTGVSEAFVYLGYTTGSQSLGEVAIDEAGSGTLVRELPGGLPAGSAEVLISGRLYASYCTFEDFSAIRLVGSDAVGGIPTPPATDTAVNNGRRAPASLWLLGSLLLGTLAGCLTLILQRRRVA